jgi:hypothetical protein
VRNRIASSGRVEPALGAIVALLRAAIANVARDVVRGVVAAAPESSIARGLIAVGRGLIVVGRGLIAVRPRLVSVREGLLAIGERLIVLEDLGIWTDAFLRSCDRPVGGSVHLTIA